MNDEIINFRILNLGGGVQSTTLALMAKTGEVEPFDVAVFADPQEESGATYQHLEWLKQELAGVLNIVTRTVGKLGDDLIGGKDRRTMLDGSRFVSIPAFTKGVRRQALAFDYGDGSEEGVPVVWADVQTEGITRRQCTSEYKIEVIERYLRRELLGLPPKARIPATIHLTQVFGLSFEEAGRVMRVRNNYTTNARMAPEFPLFDKQMTRADCLTWLKAYGVPHEVPRSACVFCPYKSQSEWRRLKAEDPEGWKRACEVDDGIREDGARASKRFDHKLYVHRSCKPLREADLRDKDERIGQTRVPTTAFNNECAGMCGL